MRLILVSAAVAIALGGCSNGTEPSGGSSADAGGPSSTSSITATDNEFDPAELEVTAGEEVTVTVTNDGEAPHTFTSEEAGFDSGTIDPGESADVTFTAPEEDVPFVCTIHEQSDDMVGTIVAE